MVTDGDETFFAIHHLVTPSSYYVFYVSLLGCDTVTYILSPGEISMMFDDNRKLAPTGGRSFTGYTITRLWSYIDVVPTKMPSLLHECMQFVLNFIGGNHAPIPASVTILKITP